MPRIDMKYLDWLTGPDTGISSEVIWETMTGIRVNTLHEVWGHYAPRDPSDFGRCHRLLELFPEWRPRLSEVYEKHPDYPEWKALIENWDELTRLYLEELPTGKAPQLYRRMMELRGECQ